MTRRLSRRQVNRWFFLRFDVLMLEGFNPEEANIIANAKISTAPVRKFRRRRKRLLQSYIDEGFTHKEAREKLASDIRNQPEEVVDWDSYRRLVYGI